MALNLRPPAPSGVWAIWVLSCIMINIMDINTVALFLQGCLVAIAALAYQELKA